MNLDVQALVGFIKEIEESRDRQKAETEFQREVFKRAKDKHFDAKAMRIVLQRRAMDPSRRDEQDYNVEAYERALVGKKAAIEALERGASTREAAKAGGISNGAAAALAKGAQKSSFVSTPHDPETGEITDSRVAEGDEGCVRIGEGTDVAPVDPPGAHPEPEASLAGEADAPAPIRAIDTRAFDEIAGDIPAHLRRST